MSARHPSTTPNDLLAYVRGARRSAADWLLVGLTWLALVANLWLLVAEPHRHAWREGVRIADAAIAALLFLAICRRWLRFRIGRIYLRRRLWELPALFPLLVPVVGAWHWVLWIVLLCRVVRVVDRTDNVVGDRITAALVEHFSDPIVEAIKRPVTVAVLDEVIEVIRTGTYAENIKAALEENHAELEAMVLDLVRQDPATGRLRHLPFHDDVVRLVADTVLRITDGALADPRTTELISDVIRNSADQLRAAVRDRH
jgi:voltage-gated potassium channel